MFPINNRTYVRLLFSFLILITFSVFSFGQAPSLTPNLPPAPEAAGLGQVTEVPIGEYTGTFNYGVPIHTLSYKSVSVPVSLSYQSGGNRVSEEASLVGLGWNLNAGGMITRTLRGGDDFGRGVPQGGPGFTGYLHLMQTQQVPVDPVELGQIDNYGNSVFEDVNASSTIAVSNCNPNDNCYLLGRVGTLDETVCPIGKVDWESDLYTFSFGGYSGKFVIGKDGVPRVMNAQNLKIEYFLEDQGTNDHSWKITTPDGISYYFGTSPETRQNTYSGTISYSSSNGAPLVPNSPGGFDNAAIVYTSAWMITKIELPNLDSNGVGREVAASFSYATGNTRIKPIPTVSADSWNSVNYRSIVGAHCLPDLNTANESWNISATEYDKITLTGIKTPFDSVKFVVSGREDLINGDKLDAIEAFKFREGN